MSVDEVKDKDLVELEVGLLKLWLFEEWILELCVLGVNVDDVEDESLVELELGPLEEWLSEL